MTTAGYYRVSVEEFAQYVELQFDIYTSLKYSKAHCALFSVLQTEIHFLQEHYDYLRDIRDTPKWEINLAVAIGDKLDTKQKKLVRYKKELL